MPAAHPQRLRLGISHPLQELANRSETHVHDRQSTIKVRDSRPRFSGVGCGGLSLVPACHAGSRGCGSPSTPPTPLLRVRSDAYSKPRPPFRVSGNVSIAVLPTDVSAHVRAVLPPPLGEKLAEVDNVLGRPVVFVQIGSITGGAHGSVSLDEGAIKLVPAAVDNMSVVGEEIMHLHRWTAGGYPATRPSQEAADARFASGLRQIAGHFDEHAFFPFLEGIGLHPRAEVASIMPQTARMLEEAIADVEREDPTDYWRVTLSAIFAQAELIAPQDAGRESVLNLFRGRVLADYAGTARAICDEIVSAQAAAPTEVEQHLLRCFHVHLRLSDTVVSVRRYY